MQTEAFPSSETFGLRMQLRRFSVNIATHIAEAHGRLNDAEMRKGLGAARAALNELETEAELARSLGFFPSGAADELFAVASEVGRLINGLMVSWNWNPADLLTCLRNAR
jgi:four helix bundle protein